MMVQRLCSVRRLETVTRYPAGTGWASVSRKGTEMETSSMTAIMGAGKT